MATITQIRGALLEAAALFLLNKIGYDTIDQKGVPPRDSEQMRSGHSGLEVAGAGEHGIRSTFAGIYGLN